MEKELYESKHNMKCSVIIPVLNEEKSVDHLLRGLMEQTVLPTEVIIVDGGSWDATIKKLQKWKEKKLNFELNVIQHPRANRSLARNIGIKKAKSEILVLTDAGCVPKKDWIELLTKPFVDDRQTEVVAGFYDPGVKNWFENAVADYTCIREWNFNKDSFLPSSRSIAFTQKIWEDVGGYPESLDTCEDLVFAERLKKHAKHWKAVKEAQVVWEQPKNLKQLNDKIFGYATGDLEAKYERHVNKIHSAKWRVLVLLFIAVPLLFTGILVLKLLGVGLFGLYIVGTWSKHMWLLKNPLNFLTLPIIQLVVDASLIQALIFHQISKSYRTTSS